jgi:Lipase (class 3)
MVSNYLEGTQGYVAYNSLTNEIIVSFRGSVNYVNWYDNFDYFMNPYPGGPEGAMMHIGFYDAYMSLSSQVIPAV